MAISWLVKRNLEGKDVCCCPECEEPADTELTYCTVCGYDIVEQAKVDLTLKGHPAL